MNASDFWPPACSSKHRGSPSPGVQYACNPAFVPAACQGNLAAIVNVMPGVSKAALRRAAIGGADIFASGGVFTTPTIRRKGATIWPLGALKVASRLAAFAAVYPQDRK